MKVADPGHFYLLDVLDCSVPAQSTLMFVKRMGEMYPGNDSHYPGTTIQEVCRALIDRVKYVNAQIHCAENELVLQSLRYVIELLERRAARRHGRELKYNYITAQQTIEHMPTCPICGHIECPGHSEGAK